MEKVRAGDYESKHWCFTEWVVDEQLALPECASYLYYGEEVCPETKKPHFQGHIVFYRNKTLKAVKKIFSAKCHWLICRGTPEHNDKYCSKEGKVHEFGTKPISRKRKGEMEKERWATAYELAKAGRIDEIDYDIRTRFYRTYKEIKKDHMVAPPAIDELQNEWWYGATGTGKSRTAHQEYPTAYRKIANKWWDGYQGQDVVILDDFDNKHDGLVYHLKIWGDHYPFMAETKGGQIYIRPKKIIITSNYHPASIWTNPESLEPVLRRYKIREFSTQLPEE